MAKYWINNLSIWSRWRHLRQTFLQHWSLVRVHCPDQKYDGNARLLQAVELHPRVPDVSSRLESVKWGVNNDQDPASVEQRWAVRGHQEIRCYVNRDGPVFLRAPALHPCSVVLLGWYKRHLKEDPLAVWPDWLIFKSTWQQIFFYK